VRLSKLSYLLLVTTQLCTGVEVLDIHTCQHQVLTCRLEVEERVGKMLEDGADIVDVGGQSTRPGAVRISAAQEAERVTPVIECALHV
jgi:dihydropteroate synthase